MDLQTIVRREDSLATSPLPAVSSIDADLQRQSAGRLGVVVLVFGLGSLFAYLAFQLADHLAGSPLGGVFPYTVVGLQACLGVAVFLWSRKGQIAPQRFAHVAITIQVLVGAMIGLGDWGWEHRHHAELLQIAAVMGIAASDLGSRFVEPINALGISLIRINGIPWLGAWILFFPMIVPLSPRRTLAASSLTALVGVGMLALSVAVQGVPDGSGIWLLAFLVGTTISLIVIVISAFFGSKFVYRLQRDLARARRMGSYSLVERIGAGGMGEVWRAEHRMLARPAAIKLIRKDAVGAEGSSSSQAALLRFEREAQATAMLTSPHTIQVYDFGITDDGDFYYVMELLHGIDLRTLVEKFGAVPAERVIHLLKQACHSLWEAHLRGLTHRDVKPANLFVGTRPPDHDFVTVLDFGLVKEVKATQDAQITAVGMATGTPAYMAPEMIAADEVDGRADLYSLGCVAYWLLTAEHVFEAPTRTKLMMRHLRDTPLPPSAVSELHIPQALDRLVLDCLAKDPAERPQSAADVITRLEECASGLESWTQARAAEWWSLHVPSQPTDRGS